MTTTHEPNCTCTDCRSTRTAELQNNQQLDHRARTQPGNTQIRPYKSLITYASIAKFALLALGVLTVITTISTLFDIRQLQSMSPRVAVPLQQLENFGARTAGLGKISIIAFIFTGLMFIKWQVAAQGNLPALGIKTPKYTPPWACLWWIIPILSLYKPYDVMKELWTDSHPETVETNGEKTSVAPMSQIIGPWWIIFTASLVVGYIAGFSTETDNINTDTLMLQSSITLLQNIAKLIALPMAIYLVKTITAHQEEINESLNQQTANRQPAPAPQLNQQPPNEYTQPPERTTQRPPAASDEAPRQYNNEPPAKSEPSRRTKPDWLSQPTILPPTTYDQDSEN